MTPDLDRARLAMRVRWDGGRERRVLGQTLDRFEERARRKRALSWALAATIVLLLLRLLPHMDLRNDDSNGFAGAGAASGDRANGSGTGGTAGTG